MKTLFRVLGAAAAVAVTGATIVRAGQSSERQGPTSKTWSSPKLRTPRGRKTAEAYAEGEAKETTPGDAWPPAFEKGSCRARAAPAAPVVGAARAEEPAEEKPAAEETTVNPVEGAGCPQG